MLYALILLLVIFVIGYIIGWWLKRSKTPAATRQSNGNNNVHRWYPDAPDSSGTVAHRTKARDEAAKPKPVPLVSEPVEVKEKKPATKPTKKTDETPKPKPKPSGKDELQRISGIGPKINGQLNKMKITTFAQIAAWKKADIEKVNEQLKFKGRIEREEWVPQAKLLAAGKEAALEKKYGTGGMKNSAGQRKSGSRTRK